MTTKEYLSQIYEYNILINSMLSEVFQLKTLVNGVRTSQNDDIVVQRTRNMDPLGDCAAKIVDLEVNINKTIDEMVDKRKEIKAQILSMNDFKEKNVLYMKYVCNKSLIEISKTIGYSYKQTNRIHGYALENFRKKYEDLYKNEKVVL